MLHISQINLLLPAAKQEPLLAAKQEPYKQVYEEKRPMQVYFTPSVAINRLERRNGERERGAERDRDRDRQTDRDRDKEHDSQQPNMYSRHRTIVKQTDTSFKKLRKNYIAWWSEG